MSGIFVLREQLQNLYAKYSVIVDKALQFILAFFTFFFINSNIGYFKAASSSIITFILAVICTFLPSAFILLFAALLILIHTYGLSLGALVVVAIVFLIMFIFYFRYTSKQALIVLLVPVAFFLKVPYLIPIGLGLAASPVSIIPLVFGTIIYYMITYIKSSASTISGLDNVIEEMTMAAQQIVANKELWLMVIAFTLCVFVVYSLRRMSFDHARTAAIVTGAVINIIVVVIGAVAFSVPVSYIGLLFSNIISALLAFVLELFVFSVDYTRSERLEYEDDDYYYYVKAIPKISVAAPEKTVKRINERQSDVRREKAPSGNPKRRKRTVIKGTSAPRVKSATGTSQIKLDDLDEQQGREATSDEILLKKTLEDELNLK